MKLENLIKTAVREIIPTTAYAGIAALALFSCHPNETDAQPGTSAEVVDAGQPVVDAGSVPECTPGNYVCDENNKLYRCSGRNEPLPIADCGDGRCDEALGVCVPEGSDYTCYRQEVDFSPDEEFRIIYQSERTKTVICPGDDQNNQRPSFTGSRGHNIFVTFPVSQNAQVAAVTIFGKILTRGGFPLSVRLDDLESFKFTASEDNNCDPLMISTGDLKLPLSYESITSDGKINVSVQSEAEWGVYSLSKLVLTTCCYNRKSMENERMIDCQPPEYNEICESSCVRYFYDDTRNQFLTDGERACNPYCNIDHPGELVLLRQDFVSTECPIPSGTSHFKMILEGDGSKVSIQPTFNHHQLKTLFLDTLPYEYGCNIWTTKIENISENNYPLADGGSIPIRLQFMSSMDNAIRYSACGEHGRTSILPMFGLSRLELQSCHYEMRPKEE